ncbi:MAG: pyridoxal phosphate-dependent aminotransferase [Clostridiales bacterium]|nr:pyridoxal phosphate-dependent aminotransferase [Clostridiales bacterium]
MQNEKNLNFDRIVDRKNTYSLKYDFATERKRPEDILPMWVADMDFPISSFITDELKKRAEHGIFGYSEVKSEYFDAVYGWMDKHFNWQPKEEWIIKTPGVVFALAMAVKAFTEKGDCVLVQQPVYYSLSETVEDNDRVLISNDLQLENDGKYHIDFEDLERKVTENNIKLFLFCSPQNPTGRVWTEAELLKVGEICRKHSIVLVSDEIHQDFVFGNSRHFIFPSIKKEFEDFSIVCTAPTKTFNIAGLQISNIFIPNPALRRTFVKQVYAAGYSQCNIMGLIACEAAYKYGEEWYQAVKAYIKGNIDYTRNFLKNELPEVKLIEPEGTYLLWLDFRELGLTKPELKDLIINKAGLWLDRGEIFGKSGEGFERINIACPREVLKEALKKLEKAVNKKLAVRYIYSLL